MSAVLKTVLRRLRDVLDPDKGTELSYVHMENMPALSLSERTTRVMKQVDRALKRVRAIESASVLLLSPAAAAPM